MLDECAKHDALLVDNTVWEDGWAEKFDGNEEVLRWFRKYGKKGRVGFSFENAEDVDSKGKLMFVPSIEFSDDGTETDAEGDDAEDVVASEES